MVLHSYSKVMPNIFFYELLRDNNSLSSSAHLVGQWLDLDNDLFQLNTPVSSPWFELHLVSFSAELQIVYAG